MAALAAAGGTAVVQAAGTDAWNGVRQQVARLFGRRGAESSQGERTELVMLERLDQAAADLANAGPDEVERVRNRIETSWQVRFADLMESLIGAERQAAAGQLRELVTLARIAAGDDGQVVGGNVDIRAHNGSAAALRMRDVTIGNPPQPGPAQG